MLALMSIPFAFMSLEIFTSANSERKMLDILASTTKKVYNYKNSFSPESGLQYIDSVIRTTPPDNQFKLFQAKHFKSNFLLDVGDPAASVLLLESLINNESELISSFGLDRKIYDNLAVAYLRMGEQTNCITNHSVDACILPIKNGGLHKDAKGSRRTIEIYEKLLVGNNADLETRWLLNIAYMTLGEYPQKVPRQWLIPGLAAEDEIKVKPFEDIAPDLKLNVNNIAGGVIIEDFDNDGLLDLVTSSMSLTENMHYFKNNGDGSFTDNSEKSRLAKFTGGLNIMQTDYNNDGFKDIFVPRGAWLTDKFGEQPNSLLRNNKDGTFTDVTIECGLLSYHPTQAATWNDFNNDGWLDVFIGNESPMQGLSVHSSELFLNNQDGTFKEVARASNCTLGKFVKGVNSGDYNNDGKIDLIISTMNGERHLLKNNGFSDDKIDFVDVTMQAGLGEDTNRSFGTWFFDWDNDGWQDILVCDYTFNTSLGVYAAAEKLGQSQEFHGQPILYRNDRNGHFTNITNLVGLNKTTYAMGCNFGDIDNDGFLDMFFGTGNPSYKSLIPNKMFKNIGGKSFADVTASAKVGSLQKGHGVAFGDMDNDGDQDIYIEMGGAYKGDSYQSSFFKNPGQNTSNNWIALNLVGEKSNKAAIGSKVKLTFIENGVIRNVYSTVNSGGSFGASPLKRELGIGQAKIINEIQITWHGSGLVQKFKNVSPNKMFKIVEGNNTLKNVPLKSFKFKAKSHALDDTMPLCVTPKRRVEI